MPGSDRIRPFHLLAYGATGLPLAALLLPLYVYLPKFYAEGLGLGFTVVGVVLLAARLWDVVTDPLIGILSDRFDSPWGRRRPWLVAGTPVVMAGVWLLFTAGPGTGWATLLIGSIAVYLGATMMLLPYSAWGAELSADYHERSRAAAAREVFVVAGTLLAAGVPALLGGGEAQALRVMAYGLLLLLPLSVALTCAGVPDPAPPRARALTARESWRLVAGNAPFRRLALAYWLNGIATGLPATLFLLYVEHALARPDLASPLLVLYFLCGIAGVPFWLALSRRIGKHRAWIAAIVLACATFVWVPLLAPGMVLWFGLICVITGFALGADLVLPPSMQADVVDVDTLHSGRPRTGLYFAFWGLATKLALAAAVGIAFPLLDLAGFAPGTGAASGTGVWALALLYGLGPVVFKAAAAVLMWGYPIDAAEQLALRQRIAAASP